MSITEAIKAFSVETLVASKDQPANLEILKSLETQTNFLKSID